MCSTSKAVGNNVAVINAVSEKKAGPKASLPFHLLDGNLIGKTIHDIGKYEEVFTMAEEHKYRCPAKCKLKLVDMFKINRNTSIRILRPSAKKNKGGATGMPSRTVVRAVFALRDINIPMRESNPGPTSFVPLRGLRS